MNGQLNSGKIKILNLASLGFLVLSLIAIVTVTANPNIRQIIAPQAASLDTTKYGGYTYEQVVNLAAGANGAGYDCNKGGCAPGTQIAGYYLAPNGRYYAVGGTGNDPSTYAGTSLAAKNACTSQGNQWTTDNKCESPAPPQQPSQPQQPSGNNPQSFKTPNLAECRNAAGSDSNYSFTNGVCTLTPKPPPQAAPPPSSVASSGYTVPTTQTFKSPNLADCKDAAGSDQAFSYINGVCTLSAKPAPAPAATPFVTPQTTNYINPNSQLSSADSCTSVGWNWDATKRACTAPTQTVAVNQNLTVSFQSPDGTACRFNSDCSSNHCAPVGICTPVDLTQAETAPTQPSAPQGPPVINNYATCNGNQQCNQNMTKVYNVLNTITFGGFGNYTSAYQEANAQAAAANPNFSASWQGLADAYASGNPAHSAYFQSVNNPKAQVAAVKLGITITAEGAAAVQAAGAVAAAGTAISTGGSLLSAGAAALPGLGNAANLLVTSQSYNNTIDACTKDIHSQDCVNSALMSGLATVNLGTAYESTVAQTAYEEALKEGSQEVINQTFQKVATAKLANAIAAVPNVAVTGSEAIKTCKEQGVSGGCIYQSATTLIIAAFGVQDAGAAFKPPPIVETEKFFDFDKALADFKAKNPPGTDFKIIDGENGLQLVPATDVAVNPAVDSVPFTNAPAAAPKSATDMLFAPSLNDAGTAVPDPGASLANTDTLANNLKASDPIPAVLNKVDNPVPVADTTLALAAPDTASTLKGSDALVVTNNATELTQGTLQDAASNVTVTTMTGAGTGHDITLLPSGDTTVTTTTTQPLDNLAQEVAQAPSAGETPIVPSTQVANVPEVPAAAVPEAPAAGVAAVPAVPASQPTASKNIFESIFGESKTTQISASTGEITLKPGDSVVWNGHTIKIPDPNQTDTNIYWQDVANGTPPQKLTSDGITINVKDNTVLQFGELDQNGKLDTTTNIQKIFNITDNSPVQIALSPNIPSPAQITKANPEPGFVQKLFSGELFTGATSTTSQESAQILNDPGFQSFAQKAKALRQANVEGNVLSPEADALSVQRTDYLSQIGDEMQNTQHQYAMDFRAARTNDTALPSLTYNKLSEIVLTTPNEGTASLISFDQISKAAEHFGYTGDLSEVQNFIESNGGSVPRGELLNHVADVEMGITPTLQKLPLSVPIAPPSESLSTKIFGEPTTIDVANTSIRNTTLRPGDIASDLVDGFSTQIPDPKNAPSGMDLYYQVVTDSSSTPIKLTESGIPVDLGKPTIVEIGTINSDGTFNRNINTDGATLEKLFGDASSDPHQIIIGEHTTIFRDNADPGLLRKTLTNPVVVSSEGPLGALITATIGLVKDNGPWINDLANLIISKFGGKTENTQQPINTQPQTTGVSGTANLNVQTNTSSGIANTSRETQNTVSNNITPAPYVGYIAPENIPSTGTVDYQTVGYLTQAFNSVFSQNGMPQTQEQKNTFINAVLDNLKQSGNPDAAKLASDPTFINYITTRIAQSELFVSTPYANTELLQCNLWAIGVAKMYPDLHIVADQYNFSNGNAFTLGNNYSTASNKAQCGTSMSEALTDPNCTGKQIDYQIAGDITAHRFTDFSQINPGDSYVYDKHFGVILDKYQVNGTYYFLVTEANSPKAAVDNGTPQTYLVSQNNFASKVNNLNSTYFLRLNKYDKGPVAPDTATPGILSTIQNSNP